MTLFELVKQNICVPDAAEHYGLQVNRNGMTCCPFHDDRHPSMKLNERYFYCFGCGATGDVIDLVARLFGLNSYEAAQKLAQDFGIDPDKPPAAAIALPKPERPLLKAYRQEEVRCLRVSQRGGDILAAEQHLAVLLDGANATEVTTLKNFHALHGILLLSNLHIGAFGGGTTEKIIDRAMEQICHQFQLGLRDVPAFHPVVKRLARYPKLSCKFFHRELIPAPLCVDIRISHCVSPPFAQIPKTSNCKEK